MIYLFNNHQNVIKRPRHITSDIIRVILVESRRYFELHQVGHFCTSIPIYRAIESWKYTKYMRHSNFTLPQLSFVRFGALLNLSFINYLGEIVQRKIYITFTYKLYLNRFWYLVMCSKLVFITYSLRFHKCELNILNFGIELLLSSLSNKEFVEMLQIVKYVHFLQCL